MDDGGDDDVVGYYENTRKCWKWLMQIKTIKICRRVSGMGIWRSKVAEKKKWWCFKRGHDEGGNGEMKVGMMLLLLLLTTMSAMTMVPKKKLVWGQQIKKWWRWKSQR